MYRKLTAFVAALALILAACGTYERTKLVVDVNTGQTVFIVCGYERLNESVSENGCKIYEVTERP